MKKFSNRVFVIDENNEQLGEMDTASAIDMAQLRGLDLVEVAPKAHPPVCRVLDYGKFQYQQAKQDRQAKAKQKKVDTKGIRIGLRTDTHDLNFKKAQAEKFLSKGHKVKVEILLRGREKAHKDMARDSLREFLGALDAAHKIEEDIKSFPRGFHVTIAPE